MTCPDCGLISYGFGESHPEEEGILCNECLMNYFVPKDTQKEYRLAIVLKGLDLMPANAS